MNLPNFNFSWDYQKSFLVVFIDEFCYCIVMTRTEQGTHAGVRPGRDGRRPVRRGDREKPPRLRELPDLYAALGVARDAKPEDIKGAYLQIARQDHPNVNPDPKAHERFRRAADAYDVLSDGDRRKQYDERWTREQALLAKAAILLREIESDPTFRTKEVTEGKEVLKAMVQEAEEREMNDLRSKAKARRERELAHATDPHAVARAEYTYETKWHLQKADPETARVAQEFEAEVKARASVEPQSYRADGRYLRISYGTEIRDVDGTEEYFTTAEWISPIRDEQGNYPPSEGIIIRREQVTGDVWIQRITRSYYGRTFQPIPETYAFVFKRGVVGKKEIKEIRESLPPAVVNPPA